MANNSSDYYQRNIPIVLLPPILRGRPLSARAAYAICITAGSQNNLEILNRLRQEGLILAPPRPSFTVTYRTPTAADIALELASGQRYDLVRSFPASASDSDATLSEDSSSEHTPSENLLSGDPNSEDSRDGSSGGSSGRDLQDPGNTRQNPAGQESHNQGPLDQGSFEQRSPDEGFPDKGAQGGDIADECSLQMPYNNAAIPPPEEISGQASLPLARVKKILNIDEDTNTVSNNAAFVITIATEMFIRYLAEQAMNIAKLEKKPRRNIQYKDLANAVARIDNLQFLEDVIPRTTTYREYKAKKASRAAAQGPQSLQNGQTTLDGLRPLPQRPVGVPNARKDGMDDGNMSDGTIDENPAAQNRQESARVNGNAGLVFEHYEPNGTSRRDESGDVEMN